MASDIPFRKIRRLLESHGWSLDRINCSHHVFTGPRRPTVTIPVHRGKARHEYLRHAEKKIKEWRETGG
ncbi:MAG: type II toxin-antitoxin system HicA family toxin [Phycisphaerales bacterium]|nr:type II toxin-antitoxin system HicA family toxin [Phycisphaerales bacterium]